MGGGDMRYFWLKLHDDFFNSVRIKKLRKLAGGDTFVIIYLKMQLVAMKKEGIITYEGYEKSFAEELAIDLDEDAENVALTLQYLSSVGLIETSDNINYFLPYAVQNTGSENASAQRVRDYRNRRQALQCNTDVTKCNASVTQVKRICNVEIEKEKDIDIKTIGRFTPPSVDEVKKYCNERGNSINANEFVDFYEAKGWMVGKNKMKDWKACVRTWETRKTKPTKFNKFEQRTDDLNAYLR